ncbi:MAG: hypothetical protein AAF539_14160 [Planctomycetota bacterium]
MAHAEPAVLCLVPTEMELSRLRQYLTPDVAAHLELRLCGFGLVAAGVQSCHLMSKTRCDAAILAGIAGAYNESLNVGTAYAFDTVGVDGIGVGEGAGFVSSNKLGWNESGPDQYALETRGLPNAGMLLSVTSASADATMAERRAGCTALPVAEDMEGYAVAMSAAQVRMPLTIARGISNRVGDRDFDHWSVDQALQSVAGLIAAFVA